jgi:hypothetical protein
MIVTLATNKNSFKKEKAWLSFALLCFALLCSVGDRVHRLFFIKKEPEGGDIPEIKGLRQGER